MSLNNKVLKGLAIGSAGFFLAACGSQEAATESAEISGESPTTIRLDYAHYSPTSVVLREQGWLEEEFAEEGIDIEWVFSQGSNRSLEFLNSDSIDFGSTAGAAALLSVSNGAPIDGIYLYSDPEWTALVTREDSPVQTVEDLPGSTVAATLGTDPHIFLLRTLNEYGISPDEVDIVSQQHSDGAQSLINGQVDAWAGLDPIMAAAEINSGAELFYREPDFNTYGFLNVREDFLESHPEIVERVIAQYERAREWTIENPDEAVAILAEEADIDTEVAELQFERNDFSQPLPGQDHVDSLIEAGLVLQETENIDESVNIEDLVNDYVNPQPASNVINANE